MVCAAVTSRGADPQGGVEIHGSVPSFRPDFLALKSYGSDSGHHANEPDPSKQPPWAKNHGMLCVTMKNSDMTAMPASQNVDQCFHIGLARHLLAVDGVLNLLLLLQQICDFLKQSSHWVGLEGPGCRLNNQ